MTKKKNYGKKIIQTKYGHIKVTRKFKYIGETICNNGSEKERKSQNWTLRNRQYLQKEKPIS